MSYTALRLSVFLMASMALWAFPAESAPRCRQCVSFTIAPPPPESDAVNFRWANIGGNSQTAVFTLRIVVAIALDKAYSRLLQNGSVSSPMLNGFVSKLTVSPLVFSTCADFASAADAAAFKPAMLRFVQEEFIPQGRMCPKLRGYNISFASAAGSCVDMAYTVSCGPPVTPFPHCACNKKPGITAVTVNAAATQKPSRNNETDLYCFAIEALPAALRKGNHCASNVLSKVEVSADDSDATRKLVTGFRVTPRNGSAVWLSPVWGSRGDKNVRATPLNWPLPRAVGGEVCMEVVKGTSPVDICMGGACSLALFNDDRKCCPVYSATLPQSLIPIGGRR